MGVMLDPAYTQYISTSQAFNPGSEAPKLHFDSLLGLDSLLSSEVNPSFTPTISLPYLVSKRTYRPNQLHQLSKADVAYAQLVLRQFEIQKTKLIKQGLDNVNTPPPIIQQILVIMPTPSSADFGLQFIPGIKFPDNFNLDGTSLKIDNPLDEFNPIIKKQPCAAYDPYLIINGECQDAGDLLTNDSSLKPLRIPTKVNGRAGLWSIDSHAGLDIVASTRAEVANVVDGVATHDRAAIFLFPGLVNKKEPVVSHGYGKGMMFDGGGSSYRSLGNGGGGGFGLASVSGASISTGATGHMLASKTPGLDKFFQYTHEQPPVIYLIRFMTTTEIR